MPIPLFYWAKQVMHMRPNSSQLAMRDPALAALLGVHSQPGADFGAEFGDEYGLDSWGAEFGDDPKAPITPSQASAAVAMVRQQQASTRNRNALLEPNKGSSVKVERYTFSVNQNLVLGTPLTFTASNQPDTTIRPQRVTMNAPSSGFLTVSEIKVANVSVTVGGALDAFQFSPLAVGQHLDMPTLSPSNRASVAGSYSGFTPPGFVAASNYLFAMSLTGPATVIA
jgi:hypothetical protein